MKRRVALGVTLFLLIAGSAAARHLATPSQRTAVVQGLGRSFYGGYLPARCARVYISTADRTWASETFLNAPGCAKYGSDGLAILHIDRHRWHVVTQGSDFRCPIISTPSQPTVPAKVAGDLIRYVHCA